MPSLKEAIRKPQHIEQQLFNIPSDSTLINEVEYRGIKRDSKGRVISYPSKNGLFVINGTGEYCLFLSNIPVEIITFMPDENFEAKVFTNSRNLFLEPVRFESLGIFVCCKFEFI